MLSQGLIKTRRFAHCMKRSCYNWFEALVCKLCWHEECSKNSHLKLQVEMAACRIKGHTFCGGSWSTFAFGATMIVWCSFVLIHGTHQLLLAWRMLEKYFIWSLHASMVALICKVKRLLAVRIVFMGWLHLGRQQLTLCLVQIDAKYRQGKKRYCA